MVSLTLQNVLKINTVMEIGTELEELSFIAEEKISRCGNVHHKRQMRRFLRTPSLLELSLNYYFFLPVQALNVTMSDLPTVPRSICHSGRS